METREQVELTAQCIWDLPWWEKALSRETAVLVLPGIQAWRIPDAATVWRISKAAHFWVAGTRGDPFYTRHHVLCLIKEATGLWAAENAFLECGGWANHTPDQMQFLRELLKANPGVKHVIMTTAAYHLPRCFLTAVKALEASPVVISPAPLHKAFFPINGEEFQTEVTKILKYQGQVASYGEFTNYLIWRQRRCLVA